MIFLWCRPCNEIHHLTRFDTAPEYVFNGKEVKEIARDDLAEFSKRHTGHEIKTLQRQEEADCSDERPVDPMREEYISVTDGQKSFVLRRFRLSIREPLVFAIVGGSNKEAHNLIDP
jgi:hypothetical protein